MPKDKNLEDKIAKAAKEALVALRKIIAGNEKLSGYYYFCSNGVGKKDTASALVITLSAKDKKGTKAASAGKIMLASLPKAKYSRGIVTVKDKKLYLTHKKGSAPISLLKNAFKKELSSLPGMGLLRKVRFVGDEEAATEPKSENAEISAQDLGLTEEALAVWAQRLRADEELAAFFSGDVTERNRAISQQNMELEAHFLSAEESAEDARIVREVSNWNARNNTLWAIDDGDEVRLQENATTLAQEQSRGPSPFVNEIGTTVSIDTQLLLHVANLHNQRDLNRAQEEALQEILRIKQEAEALPEEEQQAFVERNTRTALQFLSQLQEAVHQNQNL